MPRFLGREGGRKTQIFLYIIFSLSLLLIIAWACLYYFVYINKKPLLTKIHDTINEQVQGTIEIEDLELVFWKNFPGVSLAAYQVKVYDSMYVQHNRPYITAEEVRFRVSLPSIFSDHLVIEKISLHDTKVHIFTDSNGYSNKHVFQPKFVKEPQAKKQGKDVHVYYLDVDKLHLNVVDVPQDKHIETTIHDWQAIIENSDTFMSLSSYMEAHVHQLGFNLTKGAFLIDKPLEVPLKVVYNKVRKQLTVPTQTFYIDAEPIDLTMIFNFGDKPNYFKVIIEDESIPFLKARSFLNRHIAKNFQNLKIAAPLSVRCMITGLLAPKDLPWAYVQWSVKNTKIVSDYGNIDSATFTGFFNNNYEDGKGNVDSNTIIFVPKITGLYNGILPFYGDSIFIHRFKNPYISANIFSKFKVEALNELLGSAFKFGGGVAEASLKFRGNINAQDNSRRSLKGYLKVSNSAMNYYPRGLQFNDVQLKLAFLGEDIALEHIQMRAGNSTISINGKINHFMNAYFNNPEMVLVDWNVHSKYIDINDFKSFLIPRRKAAVSQASQKKKIQVLNQRIENILAQGNMLLRLNVDKVQMDKFLAHNLKANIHFLSHQIDLKNISVQHAQGALNLNGSINQKSNNNPFTLHGKIQQVAINDFLYGMNNFGMKGLTHENIQGKFSADIDIKGNFTDNATLLPRSLNGSVNFNLQDGALVNMDALKQIQKFAFKRRNLDSITFKDIKNSLVIEDGKVMIFPMAIESSAINLYFKGIYSFHQGTDISLEIPLRNPAKDKARIEKGLAPRNRKGLKVYLRAQDNEDGKIKISWDPFKKGGDAVDAKLHLDDSGEEIEDEDNNDSINVNSKQAIESRSLETILDKEDKPSPKKKKNIFQRIKAIFVREKGD